jgi:hypothetical protein
MKLILLSMATAALGIWILPDSLLVIAITFLVNDSPTAKRIILKITNKYLPKIYKQLSDKDSSEDEEKKEDVLIIIILYII